MHNTNPRTETEAHLTLMTEMLDIFDEQRRHIGVLSREDAHRLGHWHQTFQCWVVHRSPEGDFLLLQKRHESKDTHPGKLDTSCAGHLEAGETPMDGVREIREELGILVTADELEEVGIHTFSDPFDGILDREFCHIFLLVREGKELHEYQPAVDEVGGLYLAEVTAFMQLCRHEVNMILVEGFSIDGTEKRTQESVQIGIDDLSRDDSAYYQLLFSSLEKLGIGIGRMG